MIGWIAFGLIAGIVAKLLLPGRDPGGCIITVLLGVVDTAVLLLLPLPRPNRSPRLTTQSPRQRGTTPDKATLPTPTFPLVAPYC